MLRPRRVSDDPNGQLPGALSISTLFLQLEWLDEKRACKQPNKFNAIHKLILK